MIFSSLDQSMTALVVSSFAVLPWCLFLCFFGVWLLGGGGGGWLGRGHLMLLCTLVGQAPCFSTGTILTKWEVHCCCFEAQHQTRGVTSHGHPSPLKWSWGSAGVSTCAHQWDWTQNLYWSQGGPKMDYTNEPSPLRNPINIIFWLLTTSLIWDEHVVSRMPREQAFFPKIKYSQGFLIT